MNEAQVNNSKFYWKTVKMLIKDNKNSYDNIPTLVVKNNNTEIQYNTETEKANCLNDYFNSISTVDATNISLPNLTLKTQNTLSNIIVTESEIIDILVHHLR